MRPWRPHPFDIDEWRRRHSMGQPAPRAQHDTTIPMTARQRDLALREQRRQELARIAARDAESVRDREHLDRARRHEWEVARDRLWEERRAADPTIDRDA